MCCGMHSCPPLEKRVNVSAIFSSGQTTIGKVVAKHIEPSFSTPTIIIIIIMGDNNHMQVNTLDSFNQSCPATRQWFRDENSCTDIQPHKRLDLS